MGSQESPHLPWLGVSGVRVGVPGVRVGVPGQGWTPGVPHLPGLGVPVPILTPVQPHPQVQGVGEGVLRKGPGPLDSPDPP